jgi:HlyD family secretion protein
VKIPDVSPENWRFPRFHRGSRIALDEGGRPVRKPPAKGRASMAAPSVSRTILPPIASETAGARRRFWLWVRRLLVVAGLAGIGLALRLMYFRPVPVPVSVVRVAIGSVEELVTNNKAGTVTARRRASLAPEIGGRVVRLSVAEGDRVRKGDVLLELSDTDLRAQLMVQERSLDASRSAAVEACVFAEFAASERDRSRRLLGIGAIAQQALAQAENQWATAVASCAAANARVAQAKAAVDLARATLSKSTLYAPFDAVVSRVSTHLGEWQMPSPAGLPMPAALELVDIDSIYVRAPLDEVDAGRVRPGLAVRITMDAFGRRVFRGHVTRVGAYVSEAQQQNRTFDIDVAFEDAALARTLLPGTSADVEVILDTRDDVIRLPTSAILQGGRVLVVREGTLAAVPVGTGLTNWEVTEITEGVRPGDMVVVSLDRAEVRAGARAVVTEVVK